MKNDFFQNLGIVSQILVKSVIFGILPFLIFMMVTSRVPIFGIQSFVVLTGSMEPLLPTGNIVFTQNFDLYQIGDIVAFKSGGVNITHRIIDTEINDNQLLYRTQGDANNNPDGQSITGDKILGRVFYHIPYIGKFAIFLRTLPGFITLIIIPALIFIILEIINIKNELTKEIDKKLIRKIQTI
ncbi:signal peptidase I [Candidatus Roizmanbacteria bacterium RIFCSPHIGHO2_01_FULL_39_12c]|uniref:Signal peptidase I n=1 Tax=Candidatus Roizmanbacteria bacterium RIFCSPHIGHO2_01_FULL_39_12c TaxID=1802031 RepID=A0A1F7G9B5_9BACT|nr:MAG: signal peptidase I [Candidatus Roizmanbacteria bacterium RIFCSPHIGHO2_01_FULL_39_12c]OGK47783.1 MAG: signal peptidase I [Candidatus Roizmanbacteria bacterium RIFCSPLOWO2_01_FULL_40_13]